MDFIDEFIEEYKNNPCLWKADSPHFKNRTKRQEAYLKLIDVAAKHGEHYNVERTKQKINNLRCAFRNQLKKYVEFKNKSEKDELYCPKRRYFESLMFLEDEECQGKKPNRSTAAKSLQETELIINSDGDKINLSLFKDDNECNNCEGDQSFVSLESALIHEKVESVKDGYICPLEYDEKSSQIAPDSSELSSRILNEDMVTQLCDFDKTSQTQSKKPTICRKRSSSLSSQITNDSEIISSKTLKVNFSQNDIEKLLTLAYGNSQSSMEDHFANFGRMIAHKLRTMDANQAIYAEKLIGDVLFHGQMKLLSSITINRFMNAESSLYESTQNK